MKSILMQIILIFFLFVFFIPNSSLAVDEKILTSPTIGAKFVLIPAGTFAMGSPPDEPDRGSDEILHQVTFSKSFYMQTTLVTQGQWKKVKGSNPSTNKCGDNCPVEHVSWDDVQDSSRSLTNRKVMTNTGFPRKRSGSMRHGRRQRRRFIRGTVFRQIRLTIMEILPFQAAQMGNIEKRRFRWEALPQTLGVSTTCTGTSLNGVRTGTGFYPSGQVTDPVGPSMGSGRVLRGCQYSCKARECRSAYRDAISPDSRQEIVGFSSCQDLVK